MCPLRSRTSFHPAAQYMDFTSITGMMAIILPMQTPTILKHALNADSRSVAVYGDRVRRLDGLQRSVPHTRISIPVHFALVHGPAPPAALEVLFYLTTRAYARCTPETAEDNERPAPGSFAAPAMRNQCLPATLWHGADAVYYQVLTPHAECASCG
ncbi:hypothetical protein BV22DRAFT_91449 [Leucogyrophana mollusca]|uniref:Uncharacterized protein n=1 Tax=Leucogyrophana mollusca TaxID=85980 RepID=A0ACB8BVD6_9AGAM|nr:hypothetical protein BV22DRAFT_91449 [Leucogyrophana mollusca]